MREFKPRRGAYLLCFVLFFWIVQISFSKYFDGKYAKTGRQVASLMLEKRAILKSSNIPKILLAGGSNVYMGVSAEEIAKYVDLPVVNVGIASSAYSTDLYLKFLELSVISGDFVILSLSDFVSPSGNDLNIASVIADELVRELPSIRDGLGHSTDLLWQSLPKYRPLVSYLLDFGRVYSVESRINAFGDAVDYDSQYGDRLNLRRASADQIPLLADDIKKIQKIITQMRAQGVRVLVIPPPVLIWERDYDKWERHWKEVDRQLNSVTALNSFPCSEVFLSDPKKFYSNLHPREELRRRRTTLVIEAIRAYAPIYSSVFDENDLA